MQTSIFLTIVFMGTLVLAQVPEIKKYSVPDDASQKSTVELIADIYKADYKTAKTPDQKITLAKKLMQEGMATKDDPVGKFVLYRIARDIAAQHGNVTAAFQAIDQLSDNYIIDEFKMKVDASITASKAFRTPASHTDALRIFISLIDEAFASDRYEIAQTICGLAISSAKEAKDLSALKRLTTFNKTITEVEKEFAQVKDSLVVLETKPTDPIANFTVGWFQCVRKGNWEKGLPMLALGNDAAVKALATLELSEKPVALDVGNGWWEIAEAKESPVKEQLQLHAATWYRQALPNLSGLSKAKIERRIAEISSHSVFLKLTNSTSKGFSKTVNLETITSWVGLNSHTGGPEVGRGFVEIQMNTSVTEGVKLTGKYSWTSYFGKIIGEHADSTTIVGSAANNSFEYTTGNGGSAKGKFEDGIMLIDWKHKNFNGEMVLVPALSCHHERYVGVWEIQEKGEPPFKLSLNKNGDATTNKPDVALGRWISNNDSIFIGWGNGWRDVINPNAELCRLRAYAPGKSLLEMPDRTFTAVKR